MTSFYVRERGAHGQERFFATEHTRGPWSNDHQHGGPPMALMARALVNTPSRVDADGQSLDPPMQLTRLSVELLRPVPIAAPLEVVTEVLASGRRVHRLAAALVSGDEQLAVGVGVRIRVQELDLPAGADGSARFEAPPPPERGRLHQFEFFQHAVGYHTATEVRILDGEPGSGHVRAWMRPRMPLLADEATTALERVMLCADAGHGIGRALDGKRWNFINPDTNVHLWRVPAGEWVGMDAQVAAGSMGVGLGNTQLFDAHGHIGAVLQGEVIQPR